RALRHLAGRLPRGELCLEGLCVAPPTGSPDPRANPGEGENNAGGDDAAASAAVAASPAFASAGIGGSAIALSPVPSAADCVVAPDSRPTARPSSNPNTADTATVAASPLIATVRASTICGTASRFRLPKNWGPTE